MTQEAVDPTLTVNVAVLVVSIVAILVSIVAIVISIWLARKGWARDSHLRTEVLRGEVVNQLAAMADCEAGPATDPDWSLGQWHAGRAHHVRAIASMNAVDARSRDDALVRRASEVAYLLGDEARRYLQSGEAEAEARLGTYGLRRAAITGTSADLSQDLLSWQRGELKTEDIRSFADLYARQCEAKGISVVSDFE